MGRVRNQGDRHSYLFLLDVPFSDSASIPRAGARADPLCRYFYSPFMVHLVRNVIILLKKGKAAPMASIGTGAEGLATGRDGRGEDGLT